MSDPRSAATVQADIDQLCMSLTDIDLSRGDAALRHIPALQPMAGISRIDFLDADRALILSVDSDASVPAVGLRRALVALADHVAGDPARHYVEGALLLGEREPGVMRLLLHLAPAEITLEGIRSGAYGISRLQAFECAHVGIDAETLPAEQAEAVNLVRETLGVA